MSVAHYLAKCSNYAPDKVISFSSQPQLISLGVSPLGVSLMKPLYYSSYDYNHLPSAETKYGKEIRSMYTGDCSNTDFRKVMELLKDLDDMPEYLIVLSDMEFDNGSRQSKKELQKLWKEKGYTTKIIWWNFNSRSITVPEMDSENGNIYLSGYSPMLLKFLEAGFDGAKFLDNLIKEYRKRIDGNNK
jgi:hypothetical protein